MASQSLYRKWRSQTFGDLVGQEPVIRTLKNALNTDNLAHAYLFTGPRGTGKTSTARLLAKTINCINPVNGEPCNTCEQCREITAGNSFNVIEIDAASNRGIDSIRELREKVMVPPSTGKYKVYVLDEAHMLTTEAFNALLKTLEEPPPYAIFVMATTEVHKMLPTVLSRCQRFDFKRITTRQIVQHLNFVAEQEHVKLERSAAELIARAAAGGMRDALSLLDQAIAYCGQEIALSQVQAMLGVADPRAIYKLVQHVANLDSPAGLHQIHELSEAGADLRQINTQVGEYWRAVMLAKAGADIATILDLTEDETRDIKEMTQLFALEELTEFARIFAQNELMQKNQGTPQLGLELAFLQCVELHRRTQAGQPLYTAPAQSRPVAQPQPAARPAAPPQVARSAAQSPVYTPPPGPAPATGNGTSSPTYTSPVYDDEIQLEENVVSSDAQPAQVVPSVVNHSVESEYVQTPATEGGPNLTLEQVQAAWEKVKQRVATKNAKVKAMLNVFSVVGVEGTAEEAVVVIQSAHKFHYEFVHEGERYKVVDWALSMEFRQKCRTRLLPPGQSLPSTSHTTMSVAPRQSAYREPTRPAQVQAYREPSVSAPQAPVASPPRVTQPIPAASPVQNAPPPVQPAISHEQQSPPLARKNVVRENTVTVSSQPSSLELIKQKASSDPVVLKVMETFSAKIVDIRPK